jgi:purine-binding chemotaxis protein CheW
MNRRPVRLPRKSVDWAEVRRKLAVTELSPAAQADAAARILHERAVRLAAVADTAESVQSFLEVLSFERDGRRYAIESRFVVEVGKCGKLSRIPGAQRALLGVTNLRGDVLPVFDLALVTEQGASLPLSPQLVVLGGQNADFGVLADSVEQVTRLPLTSLSAVSAIGSMPHHECVRGITADARVLLDGDAVLRDRTVFVAKPASASAFVSEKD